MDSTYNLIKENENNSVFLHLLRKGIITLSVLDKKVYYEYYLERKKNLGNNYQAIIDTSTEYGVSERTVRRAIKFMEA